MRRGRRKAAEMESIRKALLEFVQVNPTQSMAFYARRYGVCQETVSRWFKEAHLSRWS